MQPSPQTCHIVGSDWQPKPPFSRLERPSCARCVGNSSSSQREHLHSKPKCSWLHTQLLLHTQENQPIAAGSGCLFRGPFTARGLRSTACMSESHDSHTGRARTVRIEAMPISMAQPKHPRRILPIVSQSILVFPAAGLVGQKSSWQSSWGKLHEFIFCKMPHFGPFGFKIVLSARSRDGHSAQTLINWEKADHSETPLGMVPYSAEVGLSGWEIAHGFLGLQPRPIL